MPRRDAIKYPRNRDHELPEAYPDRLISIISVPGIEVTMGVNAAGSTGGSRRARGFPTRGMVPKRRMPQPGVASLDWGAEAYLSQAVIGKRKKTLRID
jgi:hypothetical protein